MNTALSNGAAFQSTLSELENEVIAFFVDLVRWFGAPKSLGAIYGLLFVSESPICFEQIAIRLQLSNGSVSQGIRFLKDLGAVKAVFLPGERRDFFIAEIQLRELVSGFLRQRVEQQLLSGEGRLSLLVNSAPSASDDQPAMSNTLHGRIQLLRQWQEQARQVLPLVLQLVSST